MRKVITDLVNRPTNEKSGVSAVIDRTYEAGLDSPYADEAVGFVVKPRNGDHMGFVGTDAENLSKEVTSEDGEPFKSRSAAAHAVCRAFHGTTKRGSN